MASKGRLRQTLKTCKTASLTLEPLRPFEYLNTITTWNGVDRKTVKTGCLTGRHEFRALSAKTVVLMLINKNTLLFLPYAHAQATDF